MAKKAIDRVVDWLPDAARAAGCDGWHPDSIRAAVSARRVLATADAFLAYKSDAPFVGALQVEFLAVRPATRRHGIGGRVVLTLERTFGQRYQAVYVRVPSSIGLALYFWLRLGYAINQTHAAVPDTEAASVWLSRALR